MEDRAGWAGAIGDHAPAFAPIALNRPARRANPTLRTVVFNAQSGAQFDGIVACLQRPPLAGADLILLCEAGWRMARAGRREFAAELAARLGMSFVFGPEFGVARGSGPPGAFIGNAILSSVPLSDVRTIALPGYRLRLRRVNLIGEPRALAATAIFHGRPLTVCVGHLNSRGNPAQRELQMAALIDGLPRGGRIVIGGDWNTTTMGLGEPRDVAMLAVRMIMRPRRLRYPERYEPLFGRLARAGFALEGANLAGRSTFTFSRLIAPLLRPKLDWIAYRGVEPIAGSARVMAPRTSLLARRLSDHDFVMCEFALAP
ncbi:MAG: endonuclease/exonuclease/phosphatase family protein [Candidatus Binataceae bacterium]|nr:endonuclease/exonuclease/phosphatase family protein [Candidatus Binataceae bacterium]